MAEVLHCTQRAEPACAWTGTGEHALIEHYLAHHHAPSASAYVAVCGALRDVQRELDTTKATLASVETSLRRYLRMTQVEEVGL